MRTYDDYISTEPEAYPDPEEGAAYEAWLDSVARTCRCCPVCTGCPCPACCAGCICDMTRCDCGYDDRWDPCEDDE